MFFDHRSNFRLTLTGGRLQQVFGVEQGMLRQLDTAIAFGAGVDGEGQKFVLPGGLRMAQIVGQALGGFESQVGGRVGCVDDGLQQADHVFALAGQALV